MAETELPKVSFVIPTLNAGGILGNCLQSIRRQDYPQEKIEIFDARVERPPHYDTFAEFHYTYHYGDVYSPYLRQEEPLKTECQHFLDCIPRQICQSGGLSD